MQSPPYFETIRKSAAQRWVQLEADVDLAAPWHQLFRQVQSPRHVVSELLQNADDAGATTATVKIASGEFLFSHDGEDFLEEHFASLCRFGYSNKRALHTIGFRGIGFKSTFSLGDEVQLRTPTLSVRFQRRRFTEPLWLSGVARPTLTEVRVPIKDSHRQRELEKNLQEWLTSATSLLFFRHIRCLRIGDQEVKWVSHGDGPLPDSEWMSRSTTPNERYLLIRSAAEDFPTDAVEEIRQERMVSIQEETALPPCRVELVLGLEGRLFVILPTGVKTNLPFACNAPFVQDPARVKIKDPETSPTNRWLLQRAGKLAADAMLSWLSEPSASAAERSAAYALFPDIDREDNSLEGVCAAICETAFDDAIEHSDFLLSDDDRLLPWDGCISVPGQLLDIWEPEQVASFFDEKARPILNRCVSADDRSKLIHWGCVPEIADPAVLTALESKHLPKPPTWRKLLSLWAYLSDDVVGRRYHFQQHRKVRIVPVQGQEVLYAAHEVVRLGEKRLLQSESDWDFLAKYMLVLNQNWSRFLAESRRKAAELNDADLGADVEAAFRVLQALNLTEASDVSRVIDQVAEKFFAEQECELEDCVRLAHIAAALGATVGETFQYVTRDACRTAASDGVLYDEDNDFDRFVPSAWYTDHALEEAYCRDFTSCSKDTWHQWIASGRSRLISFPALQKSQASIYGRPQLKEALRTRNPGCEPYFPYVTSQFIIEDWDFDDTMWSHWQSATHEDREFWGRLFARVLRQPQSFWTKASSAHAYQVATTGNSQRITQEPLLASWLLRFRKLPCLQDTRGSFRLPADLLRRTPETEALLDVEPFVRAELDTEATRPLLKLLGVRDKPTGPDQLLNRLRALATVAKPPLYEVEKLCNRLDQLFDHCSTDEATRIRDAFAREKLIITEDGEWARAIEVFLAADDEDVPGAAIVHSGIRQLSLWRKVGVADRPTAERVMDWLASLKSGAALSADELRRVRSLLPRYPERIWNDCRHWLNLEGEWIAVDELKYALTMQSLVAWKHLFRPIKQRTADLQKLSAELCQQSPFSDLCSLALCIEDRVQSHLFDPADAEEKPWLTALGRCLSRIELETEDETARVRALGRRLTRTKWQVATRLETIPYIEGTPAGVSRQISALWNEERLLVENRSTAKAAKDVALELGRVFGRPELIDAIKLCYDRSTAFIAEYAEENFALAAEAEEQTSDAADTNVGEHDRSNSDSATDREEQDVADAGPVAGDVDARDSSGQAHEEHEPAETAGDAGEDATDGEPTPEPRPAPAKRTPAKLTIVERFAAAHGYSKDGSDRFYHADGSWIERVSGSVFPWERRAATGELLRCYWPKDQCLEAEPLQVGADVWEACRRDPQLHALLIADPAGNPIEILGKRLTQMVEQGELALHPATYRLVHQALTTSRKEPA